MAEEEQDGGIFRYCGARLLKLGFAPRQIVARECGGGLLQKGLEARQKIGVPVGQ
jgi:hypothetical protein